MALPRPFRAARRAVSLAPRSPAAFVQPSPVPNRFCSNDDRVELRRIRQERRRALAELRLSDRRSWRDAP